GSFDHAGRSPQTRLVPTLPSGLISLSPHRGARRTPSRRTFRPIPVPGRLDVQTLHDCRPRRICILKPSALGDVVQSLPVLPALRARWPRAKITWIIRDDLSELVDGHPLIDQWLPYHRRGGARAFLHLLRQLRSCRFDLVIDLQGLLRTGVMALATGAPLDR